MEREVVELGFLMFVCPLLLLGLPFWEGVVFWMRDWLTRSRSFCFGGVGGSVAVWSVHSLEYDGLRYYG